VSGGDFSGKETRPKPGVPTMNLADRPDSTSVSRISAKGIRPNDNYLFTVTARKTIPDAERRTGHVGCPLSPTRSSCGVRAVFRPHGATATPEPLPLSMTTLSERRRSVAFLDAEDETWACFLVTFAADDGTWHGYFSFRPGHGDAEEDDVRTADIFIEDSEAEIHEKARGLGRPLLAGLLDSALHTRRRNGGAPRLRGRFRTLLKENAVEIAGDWTDGESAPPTSEELDRLRSLYTSYRLDQVAHFICLVEPADFENAVDQILSGESIDFRTKDRVQFAMMVVDHIEQLLPLPDFDSWVRDFLGHPEAYRLYTHTLHREGRLP